MKKTSILLSILGTCLGIGIVLVIVGTIMGGRIGDFSIHPIKSDSSVSHTLPDVSLNDTTDIQNLSLELSASSVTVRTGDSFSITGGNLSKNKIENGTWTVKTKSGFKVSFFGFHINIPFPNNLFRLNEDNAEIVITIPEDAVLNSAKVKLSAGDIKIEKLHCSKEVTIDLSAGDVTVDSLIADKASLDLSAGDIDIKQYAIQDSVTVDCSMGDITLGTKAYALENFCNNLTADCSMGNIDVYGKLTGKSRLDSSMGDIDLKLVGSNINYTITSSDSSMGDIRYNAKDFINNSSTISTSDDNSVYGSLDLSCTMGDIDICYLYASAPHS